MIDNVALLKWLNLVRGVEAENRQLKAVYHAADALGQWLGTHAVRINTHKADELCSLLTALNDALAPLRKLRDEK